MLEEFRKAVENQKVLQALDDQLLHAIFSPAAMAGVFEYDGMPWQAQTYSRRGDALLEQLLPLSEFYQQTNAPLSAAIWGIWNATRYSRRQRSLFSMLGESKKANDEYFVGLRALVATAAVQFADGTASTVATSDAVSNLSAYRGYVESAIQHLARVPARRA